MTKYLDKLSRVRELVTWPPEGWYSPDSSPLDDIREARKLIEEDTPEGAPWPNEEWLRELGDKMEDETGLRPKAFFDGFVELPVPTRWSFSVQRSQSSRADSGRR